MPALKACATSGVLDPRRVKESFRLISPYIEHQTIWYELFISATARKSAETVHTANEAVRIVLSAYPSKVGGAFGLSDAAVQSA